MPVLIEVAHCLFESALADAELLVYCIGGAVVVVWAFATVFLYPLQETGCKVVYKQGTGGKVRPAGIIVVTDCMPWFLYACIFFLVFQQTLDA